AMIAAYLPSLRVRAIRLDGYAGAAFLSAVHVLKLLHQAREAPDCGLQAAELSKRLRIDPLQLQELLTVLEQLGWAGRVAAKNRGPSRWALLCDPHATPLGPLIDVLLLDKRHAAHTSALLGHMLSDDERDWTLDQLLSEQQLTADASTSATAPTSLPSS
ncbi:MAG: ribonuclease BN, partial [Thiomonas sp.]